MKLKQIAAIFALSLCSTLAMPQVNQAHIQLVQDSSESQESESLSSESGSSEDYGFLNVPQVLPFEQDFVQILPFLTSSSTDEERQLLAQLLPSLTGQQGSEFHAQVLPLNPADQNEDSSVQILPFNPPDFDLNNEFSAQVLPFNPADQ